MVHCLLLLLLAQSNVFDKVVTTRDEVPTWLQDKISKEAGGVLCHPRDKHIVTVQPKCLLVRSWLQCGRVEMKEDEGYSLDGGGCVWWLEGKY